MIYHRSNNFFFQNWQFTQKLYVSFENYYTLKFENILITNINLTSIRDMSIRKSISLLFENCNDKFYKSVQNLSHICIHVTKNDIVKMCVERPE